jgi:hypothetical protein
VRAPIFAKTRRLAAVIARDRGWDPAAIASWVVLADNRTNRRALAAHAAVLRAKFPIDGRTIRPWLREPTARIDALSFCLPPAWWAFDAIWHRSDVYGQPRIGETTRE